MNQRNSIVNLFSGFMPDKWKQKIEEDAKRKVRLYNLIMLIFSLFGTAICIILLETNDQCDSIPSYICKSIVSVATFCAIIFNYLEARHHRILKDAENNFVRGSDYYNKSRKRNFSLVFTSLILLIHPFPGVCMEIEIEEDVAKIQYRLDQLFMLLTLLRLGYIFRTVILYSKWDKAKGKQELEEKNITKSYYFIYKEMIEKNPFKAQMVILLISSAVCMIFLRFAEKPYEEHSGFDWSLWNTFY